MLLLLAEAPPGLFIDAVALEDMVLERGDAGAPGRFTNFPEVGGADRRSELLETDAASSLFPSDRTMYSLLTTPTNPSGE